MEDKLYQLAQKITSDEISQNEAVEKIASFEGAVDWNEVISEIKEKYQDKVYINNLVSLILKHLEQQEVNERLVTLKSIYDPLQELPIYEALSSMATAIGNLFRDTGQFEKAIPFFESSRKSLKLLDEEMLHSAEEEHFEIPSQDDLIIEEEISSPVSKMALSPISLKKDSSAEVLEKLKKDLEVAKSKKKKVLICNILFNIGKYYYEHRNLDKASNMWHECLMFSKEIEYIENIIKNYASLGKVAIEHGEMDEAISLLTFALEYLPKLKSCKKKITSLEPYKEIFNDIVTTYLSKNDFNKAFYYVEYARKWQYLINIEEKETVKQANSSNKEQYIQLLEKNIFNYNQMLQENEHFEENVTFIKKHLSSLQEMHQKICEEDIAWGKRFGRNFSFIPAQLHEKMDTSTIIIEFFITKKGICIFILDSKSIDAFFIPEITQQYLASLYKPIWEVEHFLHLWSKWCIEKSHGSQASFQKISSQLKAYQWKNAYEAQNSWKVQLGLATKKVAQAILPALISHMEARATEVHRIILIPEGILQLYPLHLMQIEGPNFQVYLQDRYEIIYAPTAAAFSECAQATNDNQHKLLIAHYTQQNIPFMREEIRIMNRIWPGEIAFQLGGNTTFENFKKSLNEVSHIHLAVHTKNEYPAAEESGISFANGRISLQDIVSQITTCNLEAVTLSANQRNIRNIDQIGDFMGLQWAFLQIGIKNVVAPMWPIPDIAIFFVNEKFYNGLGQGLSPAMALQEAQNALRKMTISDILERVKMQGKISNEKEGAWLGNLAQFLDDSSHVSFDDKKSAIATLQTDRAMIEFQDKPIKLDLRDFILDINGSIPGEKEFKEKSFRPFSHPFYWGAFYCSGVGLTESYIDDTAEDEYYEVAEEMIGTVEEAILAEPVDQADEEISADETNSRKSPFDNIKIRATCPHCATNIHCFLVMANKTAKCPKCKFEVKIPKRQVLLTEIAAGDPHSSVLLING